MRKNYLNLAISGALILTGAATAFGQTGADTRREPKPYSVYNSYMNVETDSTVNPPQTKISFRDKNVYTFRMTDEKVSDLAVNGRKIPSDSINVYDGEIRRIIAQVKRDQVQAEEDRKQAGEDRRQAEEDRKQAEEDRKQALEDARQAKEEARQAKIEEEDMKKDKWQAEQDARQAEQDKKQAERDAQMAAQDAKQAVQDAMQAKRDEEQAARDQVQARIDARHAAEDQAKMQNLIRELVKEGLVADEKSLYSLEISDTALIINGKVQPDELRKRLCARFKIGPGYSISFHK